MEKNEIVKLEAVERKIFTVRDVQVMLDSDLAELYGVETKILNQAVKRNKERFPDEFMFQLTTEENDCLRSHFVTSKGNKGGRRYLPYVFNEQGIAMLAGVLKSDIAVKISIKIINAFVAMRKFILSNGQLFQRLHEVEKKQLEHQIITDQKFEQVFKALESGDALPKQGIFFEGQVFDAYKFVSDLIRKAKKSIILIDNYVDDSVLTLFTKRKKGVSARIFTKVITKQLALDLKKHNEQYPEIIIQEFKDAHDRFLIIDNKDVYHFGASLKDLGKKMFAFSKFGKQALKILERL
ncbi:MAG: ORF6N domain-containing protein [Candidatus Omnitrophica bacterium]|nr:ORF6N domain-containing protein [Candidatus Omnitrophota bacterium]